MEIDSSPAIDKLEVPSDVVRPVSTQIVEYVHGDLHAYFIDNLPQQLFNVESLCDHLLCCNRSQIACMHCYLQ